MAHTSLFSSIRKTQYQPLIRTKITKNMFSGNSKYPDLSKNLFKKLLTIIFCIFYNFNFNLLIFVRSTSSARGPPSTTSITNNKREVAISFLENPNKGASSLPRTLSTKICACCLRTTWAVGQVVEARVPERRRT